MTGNKRGRRAARVVTALLGAIVLAGCGGAKAPGVAHLGTTTSRSTDGTTTTASSSGSPSRAQMGHDLLEYAKCMRASGVPNFPDPGPGQGFTFQANGVDPSSPAFQSAHRKCEKFMPAGSLGPGRATHPTAKWLAHMLKVAQCMRRHGVPDFPDPTSSIPSNPLEATGGNGVVSDIEGAVFVFPASLDMQSTTFAHAARVCDFPLHNH